MDIDETLVSKSQPSEDAKPPWRRTTRKQKASTAQRKVQKLNKKAKDSANFENAASRESWQDRQANVKISREELAASGELPKVRRGHSSRADGLRLAGRNLDHLYNTDTMKAERYFQLSRHGLDQFSSGVANHRTVAQSLRDLALNPEKRHSLPKTGLVAIRSTDHQIQKTLQMPVSGDYTGDLLESEDDLWSDSDGALSVRATSDNEDIQTGKMTKRREKAVKPAEAERRSRLRLGEPRWTAIRIHQGITPEGSDHILDLANRLGTALLRPKGKCKRSKETESYHMGLWAKMQKIMVATADTRGQSDEATAILNELLGCLEKELISPLMVFLEEADPPYAKFVKRLFEYIQLAPAGSSVPHLPNLHKLGPLFSVFAMRLGGGSEVPHLDFGDWWNCYAVIMALGKFKGGDFCLPHLNLNIPIPPRSILLVNARKLVHHSSPISGDRFVVTGFIDHNTVKHAGGDLPEFMALSDEEFTVWIRDRWEKEPLKT